MDGNFRPFLTAKEVCGNNPIRDMQFSISGDQFLVTSGASEAKILTREGNEVTHTVKGDPYLRDARNTKGHTSALTSGRWHPSDKNVFVTSSIDSTLRIWDINRCKAGQTYVISVKSKLPGTRSPITCTTYTADGKVLLACAQDGAIHAWSSNGPFIRPSIDIDNAHCQGSGASGVAFAFNNINFTTRGLDDTVKLWDLRNTKNPIASTPPNLPNFFEETNIMFSPNEELILTGVSVKKNDPSHGKIVLLNSLNLEVIKEVKISLSASVIKVLWHPRINQIVTGISNGSCHVLYDPLVSVRGATICAAKKAKMAEFDHIDLQTNGVIVNPNALPMFRTDGNNQKSKKRQREDKNKFKPEMPLSVKGKRGELNTKAVDFIMKTREVDSTRLEDPREAILKHADDADEDPYWVAPAYDKNQPKPVFSQSVFETEEEERQESLKKRRA
ncbi:hypothetical protein HK099_006033 [Clydaea vesicula]|uniref:WD repeat-containing protein 70 n=1 Tax=Clydaea vesicula TaxID=447962 RepID=A0AAD5U9B8_9FUNG|nr:hypothetical protein HK099_006033 [Clydaea vesicula]